jgi:hypothetical protein
VSRSGTTVDALDVAEGYDRYVERAVDSRLARMDTDEMTAHLARKQSELSATFVLCPKWAARRLPAWALSALRVELARSLALMSHRMFSRPRGSCRWPALADRDVAAYGRRPKPCPRGSL